MMFVMFVLCMLLLAHVYGFQSVPEFSNTMLAVESRCKDSNCTSGTCKSRTLAPGRCYEWGQIYTRMFCNKDGSIVYQEAFGDEMCSERGGFRTLKPGTCMKDPSGKKGMTVEITCGSPPKADMAEEFQTEHSKEELKEYYQAKANPMLAVESRCNDEKCASGTCKSRTLAPGRCYEWGQMYTRMFCNKDGSTVFQEAFGDEMCSERSGFRNVKPGTCMKDPSGKKGMSVELTCGSPPAEEEDTTDLSEEDFEDYLEAKIDHLLAVESVCKDSNCTDSTCTTTTLQKGNCVNWGPIKARMFCNKAGTMVFQKIYQDKNCKSGGLITGYKPGTCVVDPSGDGGTIQLSCESSEEEEEYETDVDNCDDISDQAECDAATESDNQKCVWCPSKAGPSRCLNTTVWIHTRCYAEEEEEYETDVDNCDDISDQAECDAATESDNEKCVWCTSKAVPSRCLNTTFAKRVPPMAFICDL